MRKRIVADYFSSFIKSYVPSSNEVFRVGAPEDSRPARAGFNNESPSPLCADYKELLATSANSWTTILFIKSDTVIVIYAMFAFTVLSVSITIINRARISRGFIYETCRIPCRYR